jgi:hypothetical protein
MDPQVTDAVCENTGRLAEEILVASGRPAHRDASEELERLGWALHSVGRGLGDNRDHDRIAEARSPAEAGHGLVDLARHVQRDVVAQLGKELRIPIGLGTGVPLAFRGLPGTTTVRVGDAAVAAELRTLYRLPPPESAVVRVRKDATGQEASGPRSSVPPTVAVANPSEASDLLVHSSPEVAESGPSLGSVIHGLSDTRGILDDIRRILEIVWPSPEIAADEVLPELWTIIEPPAVSESLLVSEEVGCGCWELLLEFLEEGATCLPAVF